MENKVWNDEQRLKNLIGEAQKRNGSYKKKKEVVIGINEDISGDEMKEVEDRRDSEFSQAYESQRDNDRFGN